MVDAHGGLSEIKGVLELDRGWYSCSSAHTRKKESYWRSNLEGLKPKNYLFQAIDRPILETILNKDTTKSIRVFLRQRYQGTTRVKCAQSQALWKEFEVLHVKARETVNEYIARTLTIVKKMKENSETLGDERILRSLTLKFDYAVCSIKESKDIDTLTFDELQSSLLVYEQRISSHVEEEQTLTRQ